MCEDFESEPEQTGAEPDGDTTESLLDRLRGMPVGVGDPNIVGDVGPTDIPPGPDPGTDGLFADPPVPAED